MVHHFREQDTHIQISRRTALQALIAGAAVTALPAVPEAAPMALDEQQLEACIEQLKKILQHMHGHVTDVKHFLNEREDGGFYLMVQGSIPFISYDGEGFYQLSLDGYLAVFWLWKEPMRRRDGTPIEGADDFWGIRYHEGKPVDSVRRFGMPNIVRKLEGAM